MSSNYMLSLAELESDIVENLRSRGRDTRNEDWSDTSRVHNWRRYIDDHIRKVWVTLSDESRGLAHMLAEMKASEEEWD